jgi:MerR family transcriptional regulator/heat shock protein HspR
MSDFEQFLHDSQKPVYTIRIAAHLVGVHPRMLRIYEERGLIRPKRTGKNYRLYSQHDLTMVKRVASLMDAWSLNLAGVSALFAMAERFHIELERLLDEMLG